MKTIMMSYYSPLHFTSMLKMLFLGLPILLIGCKKQYDTRPAGLRHQGIIANDKIRIMPASSVRCLKSYQEFIRFFGNNALPIRAVQLENGQVVKVGGSVITMTYNAKRMTEDFSLFRSQFTVSYRSFGYDQTHFSDVWTLGCVYQNAALPPFTNILKDGFVYQINTCFILSVPPLASQGLRILYLATE